MISNEIRAVLRMLTGEIDANDAYSDLMMAADSLDLICDRGAVVSAVNITLAFINHPRGEIQ